MEIPPLSGMEATRVFIFVYSSWGTWAHVTSGCCCLKLKKQETYSKIWTATFWNCALKSLASYSSSRKGRTTIFINYFNKVVAAAPYYFYNTRLRASTCRQPCKVLHFEGQPLQKWKYMVLDIPVLKYHFFTVKGYIWLDTARPLHTIPN